MTGATGMVGEGVLHECLQHPDVESILLLSRKTYGLTHPKVKEILHDNFFDLSSIEDQLTGYNACFFCLGVSSVGMKEPAYTHLTYDLTYHVAKKLSQFNNDMVFCYVSGSGTDSSEKGKMMWARVKGKTENQLLLLPFKAAYMFRPGYIQPTKGLRNTNKLYHIFSWLYPLWKLLFPNYVSTLKQVGLAMIHAVTFGYNKSVLEVKDINDLAGSNQI